VLAEKLVLIDELRRWPRPAGPRPPTPWRAAETEPGRTPTAPPAADHQAGRGPREARRPGATLDAARDRLAEIAADIREQARWSPRPWAASWPARPWPSPPTPPASRLTSTTLERERDAIGPVNLRAEEEAHEYAAAWRPCSTEQADLTGAVGKLRQGIEELNAEGRERLLAAFEVINGHFQTLFQALFGGGQAELRLVESDDPLEAGLEIFACPPGKRMASMSLMSGGEQALTAAALIFGVFLANPAPICVLDEVDAPLDDANVDRFCNMLDEMRRRTKTRFIAITHNPVTMSADGPAVRRDHGRARRQPAGQRGPVDGRAAGGGAVGGGSPPCPHLTASRSVRPHRGRRTPRMTPLPPAGEDGREATRRGQVVAP
jgi:chromosome segregation protein